MTTERWRTIPGIDDRYEVSDMGRVRSWCVPGSGIRRASAPRIASQRVPRRYACVWLLSVDRRELTRTVHRLVLLAFVGPPPVGQEARHLNGNREDNRLANLAWGTKRENYEDRIAHGTCNAGARCGRAKLTDEDVLHIRRLFAAGGVTKVALGARFGVTDVMIGKIVRRKCWTHLKEAA